MSAHKAAGHLLALPAQWDQLATQVKVTFLTHNLIVDRLLEKSVICICWPRSKTVILPSVEENHLQ